MVNQGEFESDQTLETALWRLTRQHINLSQNPHFYPSYPKKFDDFVRLDCLPLEKKVKSLESTGRAGSRILWVYTDRDGRLFLNGGATTRVFGNVWQSPENPKLFILKGQIDYS